MGEKGQNEITRTRLREREKERKRGKEKERKREREKIVQLKAMLVKFWKKELIPKRYRLRARNKLFIDDIALDTSNEYDRNWSVWMKKNNFQINEHQKT